MQTRFSDPILKASAEYHASSTYMGLKSCTQVVQVIRGGRVHGTVHHQLEIVGLVKSMTVQEADIVGIVVEKVNTCRSSRICNLGDSAVL